MDYTAERENNIIKNIAREIEFECSQEKLEVTPELAEYVVKLKLLNPENGFTASEVMPRTLTQKLVTMVIEDLALDNPSMNCIRMQVFWSTAVMNLEDLKRDYVTQLSEKAETHLNGLLDLEEEERHKIFKLIALYTLVNYNVGSPGSALDVKETIAASHSVFKINDLETYFEHTREGKLEVVLDLGRLITGIRLYLRHLGKAGEGVPEVGDLLDTMDSTKRDYCQLDEKLNAKIESLRDAIASVVREYVLPDTEGTCKYNLDKQLSDWDEEDLTHAKKLMVILLQHKEYLSDVMSKLDEIDGSLYYFLKEFENVMEKLRETIKDRHAVPTTEVFDDFEKATQLWMEIQSYNYCFEKVQEIAKTLETIDKKEYFAPVTLEKAFAERGAGKGAARKPAKKTMSSTHSGAILNLDIQPEFQGFCAWTLYYNEGVLVPGHSENGTSEFQEQYFAFSSKFAKELWDSNPQDYLMGIYEHLRKNPELIGYLKAYENLYNIRTVRLGKKLDRKIPVMSEGVQTLLHPIEEYWDKDHYHSTWELKRQALALSRLVKCVTKSVQTESPHSHFRASIGVLAAPDKDKQCQTKKDAQCNHSTVSNYLYGLRGHKEDKFCVVELTRPVDEAFQRVIVLEEEPCVARKRIPRRWSFPLPCPSDSTDDRCYHDDSSDYLNEYNDA